MAKMSTKEGHGRATEPSSSSRSAPLNKARREEPGRGWCSVGTLEGGGAKADTHSSEQWTGSVSSGSTGRSGLRSGSGSRSCSSSGSSSETSDRTSSSEMVSRVGGRDDRDEEEGKNGNMKSDWVKEG